MAPPERRPEPKRPRPLRGSAITGARSKRQIGAQQAEARAARATNAAAQISGLKHSHKKRFVGAPDMTLLTHLVEGLEARGKGKHRIELGTGMSIIRTETGTRRGQRVPHFTLTYTWTPWYSKKPVSRTAIFERDRSGRIVKVF